MLQKYFIKKGFHEIEVFRSWIIWYWDNNAKIIASILYIKILLKSFISIPDFFLGGFAGLFVGFFTGSFPGLSI